MPLEPREPSWKSELKKKLIEKLYHPARSKLLAELDNLLVEHRSYQKIPNTKSVHAYFNGQNYLLPADIPGVAGDIYINLDPKFHQNLLYIQEDHQELNKEREEIKGFLRRLLNQVGSEADIETILPKSFFKAPLTTAITMTPTQTDKLRRENLSYIETIKRRMVENLISR